MGETVIHSNFPLLNNYYGSIVARPGPTIEACSNSLSRFGPTAVIEKDNEYKMVWSGLRKSFLRKT